jgi:hypothetical protein
VRVLLPIALLGLTSVALADRLITIPTGSKIKLKTIKAEGQWEQSRARSEKYYFGTGITDAIDAEFTGERFGNRAFRSSLAMDQGSALGFRMYLASRAMAADSTLR